MCAVIPLYEDYWVTDEKTDDLGHLVNADSAFVDERKLTQYSLNKESLNPDARSKAEMFSDILGFEKENWRLLQQKLVEGVQEYRPNQIKHSNDNDHYTIMIPVRGLNGNEVVLETAWQYLGKNDYP